MTALPALTDGERVALWARLRPTDQPEGVRRGIAARGYCKSSRLLERQGRGDIGPVRKRRRPVSAPDSGPG